MNRRNFLVYSASTAGILLPATLEARRDHLPLLTMIFGV